MRVKFQGGFTIRIYLSTKISSITLRVNHESGHAEHRQGIAPMGQFFCFLGSRSWQPASAGSPRCLPHEESLPSFKSSSLVLLSSVAVCLVVVAVSSEIADAAADTVVMADVNFATVAELLSVFLPEGPCPGVFPGCLSCQSFAFLAGVNLLYTGVR